MKLPATQFVCAAFATSLLIHAQTTPSAPVLTALFEESAVLPNQIDLAGGLTLPPNVLAAIQSGAEIREQLTYDSSKKTLQVNGVLVPAGTASPTPAGLAGLQTLWSYTVSLDRIDLTSSPKQSVAFIGRIAGPTSPAGALGDLTGSLVTVTAGYTTPTAASAPVPFQAVTTSVAGVGALFSASGAGTLKIVNPATAQLPVAVAGPKGTQVTTPQFTLDGTQSSDPGGLALSYSWVFLPAAGQSVTISGASTATPAVTISDNPFAYGTYTFQLTVVDASGLTSSDMVSVEYISPQ